MLPVAGVAAQAKGIVFVPIGKLKGPGATRVATEVFAPVLCHFVRYDVAVGHTEYLRQWAEGGAQAHLYRGIVCGYEGLRGCHVAIEYPCTGGGDPGVDDAGKTVDNITCYHLAALALRKGEVIMKVHIAAQVKGIGEAIGCYVPAFGERGYCVQVFVSFYECVVEHMVYPHHVQVLGIGGIHGFEVAAGDIEVEDGFGGIGRGVAGKEEEQPRP